MLFFSRLETDSTNEQTKETVELKKVENRCEKKSNEHEYFDGEKRVANFKMMFGELNPY